MTAHGDPARTALRPADTEAHSGPMTSTDEPKRWRVRLVCCGRDDGAFEAATWEEADAFRNSYTSGPAVKASAADTWGHERAAIIEEIPPTTTVQAARTSDAATKDREGP